MLHFVNNGDGWMCRHCHEQEETARVPEEKGARARFFSEGEAEEREPKLSSAVRARWRDAATRRILFCPRCNAEEPVSDSPSE